MERLWGDKKKLFLLVVVVVILSYVGYRFYKSRQQPMPKSNVSVGGQPTMVLFHSTGCGHCIKFMPVWKKFADMHERGSVMDVEASSDPSTVGAHAIQVFPTVRFYPNGFGAKGTFVTYNGDRTIESLEKFFNDNMSA